MMRRLAGILVAVVGVVSLAAPATAAPSPYGYPPCGGVVHQARVAAGLPPVFDNIASRESLCIPWARSGTRDTGAWQINDVNIPFLRRFFPGASIAWLKNPWNNARAAALLCYYWLTHGRGCLYPWR